MISSKYTKLLFRSCLLVAALFLFKKSYMYFTHDQQPQLTIVGIEDGKSYADTLELKLCLDNPTTLKYMQVLLDGKEYEGCAKKIVGKKQCEEVFSLDTRALDDGEHALSIKAIDGTYHKNKIELKKSFFVDNKVLQASFVSDSYEILQGRTAHILLNSNKELADAKVSYLNKEYVCCKTKPHTTMYECFIPIECDQEPETQPLLVSLADLTGKKLELQNSITVKSVEFPKQKGFSVAQEKIQDEKDVSLSSDILSTALERWVEKSPLEKLWKGTFDLPCQVTRYSTPFGEIRVTPERGRYLHKAVDIVHTPRTVVWASARGKVIIKDRYLMSGNTVVLDHGMGVHSLYFHLHDFADIEVGDFVEKGQKIGRMGKTGYATGYHLHWEVRINNIAVDPLEWTTKQA